MFVVLLVLFAAAQQCFALELVSREGLSAARLNRWLPAGQPTSPDVAQAILTDSLVSHGYFSSTVDVSGDTLEVRSGPIYTIGEARILGDTLPIPKVLFGSIAGDRAWSFDSRRIEDAVDAVLTWCENNGYPFAQVEIDSLQIDASTTQVIPHLKLLAGPRTLVEFLKFKGNRVSKPGLLIRESRLRTNTLYSQSRVALAGRRLSKLEYIRSVSDPRIVIDDEGRSGLLFEVSENKLSRVDIAAGLTPRTEGETQTITGLFDLQFLNLFGTGRRGKVYWQRPANGVQELAVSWREPWVARTPAYAEVSFNQRVEDTLYVTRKYGGRIGYALTAATEVFGGVSREELLADSTTAATFGFVLNQTLLFEAGLVVDTRDHQTNPRNGIRFESTAARGRRMTVSPPEGSTKTDFEHRRATVDIEMDREVRPFWVAHFSGHARALLSDEPHIQQSDLYRLGGARTLRGYREEQFLGEQIYWTTLEARYLLGPASRIAFFTDWGAVANEDRSIGRGQTTDVNGSYGLGLRLETPMGVWGVDYGISTGNSPLNGQLHVSLLSLF